VWRYGSYAQCCGSWSAWIRIDLAVLNSIRIQKHGNWSKLANKPDFLPSKGLLYLRRWYIFYLLPTSIYFPFKNFVTLKSDQDPDPDPQWFGFLDPDPDPQHWLCPWLQQSVTKPTVFFSFQFQTYNFHHLSIQLINFKKYGSVH
jgi:hypothetical protein